MKRSKAASRRTFVLFEEIHAENRVGGIRLKPDLHNSQTDDRRYHVATAERIARPVLTALAAGRLKTAMPVEAAAGFEDDRAKSSHLEAWCRTLAGIAPWLEATGLNDEEAAARDELRQFAVAGMSAALDPHSPDYTAFGGSPQSLVEAAFLARALLQAPQQLWGQLDAPTQQRLIGELKATRACLPSFNNWLMFPAIIETFLLSIGAGGDKTRIEYAVQQHEQWYLGDGIYADGPHFQWDYYNSLVIQPLLVDVVLHTEECGDEWGRFRDAILQRAQRHAAIQERFISPEGTFPVIGRSLAYRYAAFQLLAQMALQKRLPPATSPAQVRCALTAVIRRLTEAPGTFDSNGWLQIGFCGHQPAIGEPYISTGSLYLTMCGLLALGLAPDDEFWSAPSQDWTAKRAFGCQDVPFDLSLEKQQKAVVWTREHQRVV